MGVVTHRRNFRVEVMADSLLRLLIGDSVYLFRLITIQADFSRIILSELNTHRLLSRNSASSRAIPIERMIEMVMNNPFIPFRFPKTHKGMQTDEWIEEGTLEYEQCVAEWLLARDEAVARVKQLNAVGISKQIANRILEPFLMHRAIISATEWENLLALRAHRDAQYEFQVLAYLILEAINQSVPQEIRPGEWHRPFGDQLDLERIEKMYRDASSDLSLQEFTINTANQIVVARCARVSYRLFKGKDDYEADVARYVQLRDSGHWSPFEHVARAMTPEECKQHAHVYPDRVEYGWCGNFRGFVQLRKDQPREVENRFEPRLLKH